MSRKKRWEETGVTNGFGQYSLFSWRYFFDFIYKEMLDYHSYIWRGQRCEDWPLESTLDRLKKTGKAKIVKYRRFENEHLDNFKYAARGRRGIHPPLLENENEWWALGQHYGLSTPLLDWTSSPFVAAYFAFVGIGEIQTESRAIYALNRPGIEKKANENFSIEKERREQERKDIESGKIKVVLRRRLDRPLRPEVEFVRPLSDENQRLVNQGGLFTRFPTGVDVQSWVQKTFSGDSTYTLIKITIPNKDRAACLKALNRMNINHLTLFPDLYGASKFCNLYGEIDRY